MSYDPNNKLKGTTSNKLRKVIPVRNIIIKKIDENQNIKRLSRYITKTPLAEKGLSYDGSILMQQDLKYTLTKDSDVEGVKTLFNIMFNPENIETGTIVHIFVSPYNINTGDYGTMYYDVSIVCDVEYDEILPNNDSRIWKIANEVCDMLDGYTLDMSNPETEDVGNLQFKVVNNATYTRISKTSSMMHLAMVIAVDYVGMR